MALTVRIALCLRDEEAASIHRPVRKQLEDRDPSPGPCAASRPLNHSQSQMSVAGFSSSGGKGEPYLP